MPHQPSSYPTPSTPHEPSRADLGRLEVGWQARWQEAADGTADLRGRLDRLQTSSASQAQEVSGALQALQGELAQQRSRLEAVERAQQACPASGPASTASPAKPAEALDEAPPAPVPPLAPVPQPTPAPASVGPECGSAAPTVAAILRRLGALEDRVEQHLHTIEAACALGGGPSSAPVSPTRSGSWSEQEQAGHYHHHHRRADSPSSAAAGRSLSRAQRAAAVAAAAVYGSDSLASEVGQLVEGSPLKYAPACWEAYEAAPGSPRIGAAGLARPASAGPGYSSGGRRPPSSAERSRSRQEVEKQVAQTHAIIAGLQSQSKPA